MRLALVNYEELKDSHVYKMLDSFIEIFYLNAFVDRMDSIDTEERQYVINALNNVINTTHEYKANFCKQIANFILGFYAPTTLKEAEILFCNKFVAELKYHLDSYKFREHRHFEYKDQTDSAYSAYMLTFHQEVSEAAFLYLESISLKECETH